MNGITHVPGFITVPAKLFDFLVANIEWNEHTASRKIASYGKAYTYDQQYFPDRDFLPQITEISHLLESILGFIPNNCIINYYTDGNAKMSYHSDDTDVLNIDTGIAIISLGETRTIKFRNIEYPELVVRYGLQSGSLLYMTQELQRQWQHSIPRTDTTQARISLSFRSVR